MIYTIQFTTQELVGNQTMQLEIAADSIEGAWAIADELELAVDGIWPSALFEAA